MFVAEGQAEASPGARGLTKHISLPLGETLIGKCAKRNQLLARTYGMLETRIKNIFFSVKG